MANTANESSFKVDNVDTFNTHMLQILTKEKLGMLPETLKVLTACIERRYEPCSMKDPRDFMMVDGKGKLIARFSQLRGREMTLKEFTSQSFSTPAQASFKECDKIVKCIKGHQQQMAHMRVPSVDYVFGGISRVCAIPLIKNRVAKQGHCFFNLLIAISYFVRAEDDAMFANIVGELDGVITYWPKLSDVSKYAQYIIAKLPYLGAMPIPVVAANHGQKLLHICDQRGAPHGWHAMKMGLLAELANAGFMKGSAIPNYYVGGTNETTVELYSNQLAKVQQRLRGWISRGNMMDDLVSDTQLAAFVILSPALLSRLQNIIEIGVSEAINLEKLEASHENKLVAVTAVKAALVGVRVKSGVKDIEKIWLHIHSLMMGIYDEEENQYKGEMRHAVTRLYATLIAEKKYITACERALYNATEEEFSKSFGCQPTWYDKLSFTAWREKRRGYLGPAKIKLTSLDDGITGVAFQFLSSLGIQLVLGLVKTGCKCYTLARFLLYIFLLLWGSLSLSKFVLFCLKQLIIRKFSDNYKKLVFLGAVFMVIELASYVSKKIKAQKNKEQELQLHSKENEKKMMAAMAMVTLFVHAIDMDLALVMTNSLNHVARLVNLLTDSTTGWLVGGAGRQELQMKIFDLALEVDDKLRAEEEISVATTSNQDSFAAWVNEQMTMGNDNTRPLSYGRSDSTFALNSTNATEIGQAMVETKKAWSLVVGQTGSGKSTKVPIAYYNKLQTQAGRKKNILICEPTQATTQNVAAALSHFHGKSVYYKHEGKEQHGDSSIQVMTYGSAFFKSVNNPSFLSHFDAVFLDESHLISPHSLSMEGLLNKQTEVRKFYLTATPRDHQFKVAVNRRFEIFEHPVEKADVADFIAALGGKTNLDALQYGNNVLVFLSGKSECDRAAAKVSGGVKGVKSMSLHKDNFKINYQKIVDRLEHDEPTVIFTTNILETGVTLNVDVVVDFGYTNAPVLNFVEKTLLLRKRRVTDAERQQRIGRAGRLRDGHAITIGKTVQTTELVCADVVYEAALLSFVYNLDVYINAHFDHSWLAGITRAQARTMLSFRMNSFFMRDLVFADGSLRPEMLQALKGNVQRSANIRTSTMQCISHVYESWPVLGAYAPSADNMNDQLARSRVPFVTHDLFDLDIDAIAMAVKAYRTPVKSRWGKPVKEVANVIMYANQNNIHDAIRVAQSMRAEAKKQILEKERVQNMHRESPLACLFSKSTIRDLEKKLGEQIQMARRNLDKLNKFISNLEIFASSQEIDDDIDMTPDDLGEIGQCMELQMNTTCCPEHLVEALKLEELPSVSFRDAIILGRQRVATAMMILCVAAFSGLAWWYMWSDDDGLDNEFNSENKKQVYKEILEMKGKSFNRDKRMPAMQEHIAMADEYIENNPDIEHFKSKRSSGKKKSDGGAPLDRYMSQGPQPFLSLYDITMDEDVVKAVFSDENKHAFYETSNPLKHMKDVEKHLNEHKAKSNLMAWGDEANDLIYCTITKNDGSIQRVRLTPHNPYRFTKHHGTQGYEEKAGQFRQSGQTEILRHPQQELEIATHLQTSNVNLDISKMIGLVTVDGGQICCIMYKDFIIMPAHVMMKKLPMKISFAHCTVTVNELPEMYSFIGYDMVLVRRPSELAPVKCQAHCGNAHDGMLVQMIYRKPVTNKAIPTITAPIHQTKEHRWAHQIPTHHGMCGCPVIDVVTGKIVGIHVMGDLARKHNVFEAFPSEALTIINTNDRKVHSSFFRNKVNLWVFQPEMHGYLAKNLTNLQMMGMKSFSRDTSIYTVENFIRSARCGGLLKHREVFPPIGGSVREQFEHFDDLAYAHALLNTKHTYVGENPYWLEFKRNHQVLVKGIEEYEDAYLPSRLTHSAYWKDLGKYNRAYKTTTHDDGILLQAANCLIQMLKDAGMMETRIQSPDEVLRDVQWNKAAGPLYGMKKRELCKNLTDEELISLAIHCRHELVKGENAGVWNGSLKAELRPLEKVLQDKTRVFTAAPITTLLGAKAYVDDFNKQFYKTHLHAPHTVGINKFQRGWERVYEYLNKPGWLHGSGDGSRFDASIDPFLFDVIYSIRCYFMAPEDRDEAAAAMSNMYREFVFTPVHTIAGNIIMKKLGNNSGQPSTVVDNTLVLILSFLYAYISKTGDSSCSQLHERFRFVCNGDDNKFSISREFESTYGGDFSNEIEDLGLHYEFDILTDNIMENPYMSLTMVAHNAGVGFQLNPRRIVGIVQWIKKGGVVHAAQAAFAAAIEAYNDPWLYGVMNLYLIWLLCEYRDALLFAEMNDIATVCYMDPLQVHALHYGRYDDDDLGEQELQMDPDALKKQGEAEREKERKEREQALAAARKGKELEKLEKPLSDIPPATEKPKGTGDITTPTTELDSDDDEIQWKMPAIQRHSLSRLVPTIQGRKVWNAKVLKHIPEEQFESNSARAKDEEYGAWVDAIKSSLGVKTETDYQIILTAWCLLCANSGTSSEMDASQFLEVHDGNGRVGKIQAKVFISPAKLNGGLRRIMRRLSEPTSQMLARGGRMTTWGMKRGLFKREMIPYAFDFYVATPDTPKTVREQLAQAKIAAIGSGVQRAMITDGKLQRVRTSYERHTDGDNSEHEHGDFDNHDAYLD
ncbi:polyprotein [Wuhan poty-like virus 1]|uniref:polyprotein n=1 Tax=Wuhan poty-like virus 1 TaxID=1923748 RepID=UPI000909818F|nr:polyprotein [Wuhan poty-like virus 1]APG79050.1 polyprotein [Wuhan poty-like virus 1]